MKALSRGDVLEAVILGCFTWEIIRTLAFNIISLAIN